MNEEKIINYVVEKLIKAQDEIDSTSIDTMYKHIEEIIEHIDFPLHFITNDNITDNWYIIEDLVAENNITFIELTDLDTIRQKMCTYVAFKNLNEIVNKYKENLLSEEEQIQQINKKLKEYLAIWWYNLSEERQKMIMSNSKFMDRTLKEIIKEEY